ncbi:hypothetical protein PHYBLDRAFT_67055 [Phycomyces blakesleeanus NRRL 1555(-)]|uniref:Uncharacterized protein n=1 Tax=Phycomyces blakesleeanus (strain ATCC 8743b / DSM 1359 / FGSC 10004 / NBRC 33097 / NRRL 1555) TaxID=763407 RepID=A0A162WLV4_PHYB8|nr:hypothetical protein PHYBLDRAFT_67055 [Phycomyces blakesleeanus NRRL 1555(-)]OAD68955.1 hypothetical protein PHYBLDRAFT_67055 [Phycomyces blakesleeanus NRRL 1555(-)]|eukprot:XP_018286995.1 hypothetical protein PHYBLDRAFT_67055 [Phycomyces blakesleeanus NRRL 1555(-)]
MGSGKLLEEFTRFCVIFGWSCNFLSGSYSLVTLLKKGSGSYIPPFASKIQPVSRKKIDHVMPKLVSASTLRAKYLELLKSKILGTPIMLNTIIFKHLMVI